MATAKEIVTGQVGSTRPSAKVERVPGVEEGSLVGIVSCTDIPRALPGRRE